MLHGPWGDALSLSKGEGVYLSSVLTDLHLQKYLQGRLSAGEERELEALLEKNPDLKKRLEELEARGSVTRPAWERTLLDRNSRRGSRVRYATILPALLILLLIVALSSHWFSKPGSNSTFLHAGGNGTAVELLYYAAQGWRYFDAGFRTGDSLTFAVRDGGKYAVRIFAIAPGMPEPVAEEIWGSPSAARYGSGDAKPAFAYARPQANTARFLAVVYDTGSLASLSAEELPGLLREGGGGGRVAAFRYQIFHVPENP